jgi:hypothetical protein
MTIKVGYAQEKITPSLERPVYLAGFGQNRRAETVNDDLYVNALALSLEEIRVVVAALDLIGLGRQHCQEIERRVNAEAPGTQLLVSCTHTHHGPDTIGLWGPDVKTSGVDPIYMARLRDKIVAAALAALDRLEPAALRACSVQATGLAKNARAPEIVDEELTCLQFCDPMTGRPLATWFTFPCHPEVLGDQNPHITSDYVGALRRGVEVETSAPCLVMVGALGGMMTPDVEEHSFAEAERMGQALASAALDALAGCLAVPVAHLMHMRREYVIPMTNPIFRIAIEGGFLPNLLNDDGTITTEANLLRIGQVLLFGVPGELFPELGLDFKGQMCDAGAEVAVVLGLTNDELGYILPRDVFVYPENPFEPGEHYEETMSMGPEAGPRLRTVLDALLEQE